MMEQVKSLNTKVDLVIDATAFTGLTDYGQIMVGDQAFESYHARAPRKFIQIPWDEVDLVLASVLLKGKSIPRYALQTKKNGTFTFSSKKPKTVLRAVRHYVPSEKMVQSLSFLDVVKRGLKSIGKKNK